MSVIFATGARDGNVMVWDMRCNRRTGRFCQPVNVISNAHTEKVPGTPQTTKKKTRRVSTPRPVMVRDQPIGQFLIVHEHKHKSSHMQMQYNVDNYHLLLGKFLNKDWYFSIQLYQHMTVLVS